MLELEPELTDDDLRVRLKEKAQNGRFYAEETLLGMDLTRDCEKFILLLQQDPEPETEATLLVRLLETYYVTQGDVRIPKGHSFYQFLAPLIALDRHGDSGRAWKLPGNTAQEYRRNIQQLFEQSFSGTFVCRGFAYAFWRMQNVNVRANDNLLDAYCLLYYVIQLLQGQLQEFLNMELGDVVESELSQRKHDNVDMTADDLLWCCCILLLDIGSKLRQTSGARAIDHLLSSNLTNQEILVGKLAMEIRPEAPISYLRAYVMTMETKALIPPPLRKSWMDTAYSLATQGLDEAEQWGDPYFLYLFHTIYSYWMPTQTNPTTYSYTKLQARIKLANDYKAECVLEGPASRLGFAKLHEDCLEYLLALHIFDKEANTMPALVDAFWYPIPPDVKGAYPTSTKESVQPAKTDVCHYCAKALHDAEVRATCSRCRRAEYCSTTCQASHWKMHLSICITNCVCANCSKGLVQTKKLGCSKCGMTQYCNRKCQLVHWKNGHKKDCRMMSGGGC
jgi:MYND finger